MARFVALNLRTGWSRRLAAALVVIAGLSGGLRAQQPMMASTPSAKAPATNATSAIPPATLGQYGKILAPGDQPAHPLKLRLPFPDVGQVKIPSADELVMRDKLEQLAMLSDADIRTQLDKWPAYGKMTLRDQGSMLMRIQDFRDFRTNTAKAKAHDMGLLTLTPPQFDRFQTEYWNKRLQMDNDLAKQFTPVYRAREQKMQDELYREFSAVSSGPMAQGPKPGAPASKPPGPVKPVGPVPAVATSTNRVAMPTQPVAQAPQ